MPNYQQTTDTADSWKRCFRIIIDNPLEQLSSARFFEEEVVTMLGKTIRAESGNIIGTFYPEKVIMLRNPETGELTGAYTTQGNLYTEIYSLYMQLALERDLAQQGV